MIVMGLCFDAKMLILCLHNRFHSERLSYKNQIILNSECIIESGKNTGYDAVFNHRTIFDITS